MKKNIGEKHHIKPRSLFPDLINDKENIVKLTYREHYICHWLLTKIYPSKEMTFAFWLFHSWNKDKEYFNSYAYAESRKAFIDSWSAEMTGKFVGEKNGMWGRSHTPEARAAIGEASRNRSPESNALISEKLTGFKHDEEFCEKCRQRMLGNTLRKGKSQNYTPEQIEEMRQRVIELWKDEEYRNKVLAAVKASYTEERRKKFGALMKTLKWWHKEGEKDRRSAEKPGDGWEPGRSFVPVNKK